MKLTFLPMPYIEGLCYDEDDTEIAFSATLEDQTYDAENPFYVVVQDEEQPVYVKGIACKTISNKHQALIEQELESIEINDFMCDDYV